jgi:molecular chaperone DnaK (HSP70)
MSWLAIDFGTSECSAAYIKDGGIRKVKFTSPDSNSQYDFPTVAFVDEAGKIEVGYQALSKAAKKPENFIYEFKLDLNNDHDKIEGISSVGYIDVIRSILSEIKKEAETADNYGNSFTNAIITIPVGFQQNSIDKIKKAALDSKFNKIEFVSEPQAAAVYFNHFISENFPDTELNALIYDLGGGTFDPALISIKNSNTGKDFSLPISGEGTLRAGKFFDKLIRQEFVNQFPIPKDNYTVHNQEVQDRCKNRIKRVLSGFETATVNVPFNPSETFTLSKDEFNQMIAESVDETIVKCDKLLNSNNNAWNDIDLIFLVGGSCNVPYVRKCVEIHAKKINPNIQIIWNEYSNKQTEPQYAVSLGAALHINHLKDIAKRARKDAEEKEKLKKEEENKKESIAKSIAKKEELERQIKANLDFNDSIMCDKCKSEKCYWDKAINKYRCTNANCGKTWVGLSTPGLQNNNKFNWE